MLDIFHVLICHLYILFSEVSFHVFCPLSNYICVCVCVCVKYVVWQYFLPVWSLSFYPLDKVFCMAKAFNFDEVQFVNFFLLWIMPLVLCLGPKTFLIRFLLKFLVLHLKL